MITKKENNLEVSLFPSFESISTELYKRLYPSMVCKLPLPILGLFYWIKKSPRLKLCITKRYRITYMILDALPVQLQSDKELLLFSDKIYFLYASLSIFILRKVWLLQIIQLLSTIQTILIIPKRGGLHFQQCMASREVILMPSQLLHKPKCMIFFLPFHLHLKYNINFTLNNCRNFLRYFPSIHKDGRSVLR